MVSKRRKDNEESALLAEAPRSVALAAAGVSTGEDFAKLMSALMSDVIEGKIATDTANAVCNAGGKMLKVVEMQYKFGKQAQEPRPVFRLV